MLAKPRVEYIVAVVVYQHLANRGMFEFRPEFEQKAWQDLGISYRASRGGGFRVQASLSDLRVSRSDPFHSEKCEVKNG